MSDSKSENKQNKEATQAPVIAVEPPTEQQPEKKTDLKSADDGLLAVPQDEKLKRSDSNSSLASIGEDTQSLSARIRSTSTSSSIRLSKADKRSKGVVKKMSLARKDMQRQMNLFMKQDLASWISSVLQTRISGDTFYEELSTGMVLCQLLRAIDASVMPKKKKEKTAEPGDFKARANLAIYHEGARTYGLRSELIFSMEDLQDVKQQKLVINNLLGLARIVAVKNPLIALPQLVQDELNDVKWEEDVVRSLIAFLRNNGAQLEDEDALSLPTIRALQTFLQSAGLSVEVDGALSGTCRVALQTFLQAQGRYGGDLDGQLAKGSAAYEALKLFLAEGPVDLGPAWDTSTVRLLQRLVNRSNFADMKHLEEDGEMTVETFKGLQCLLRSNGLEQKVDGEFGVDTYTNLQTLLKNNKVYTGKLDGALSAELAAGLKTYLEKELFQPAWDKQLIQDLQAFLTCEMTQDVKMTGTLDADTCAALNRFLAQHGFAHLADEKGMSEATVNSLQQYLVNAGLYEGLIDGHFSADNAATKALRKCVFLRLGFMLQSPASTVSHPVFPITHTDKKKLQGVFDMLVRQWQLSVAIIDSNPVKPHFEWVKDEDCSACTLCHEEFGFFFRRHHCRLCGMIYCNNCSLKRCDVGPTQRGVRTCNTCYMILQQLEHTGRTM